MCVRENEQRNREVGLPQFHLKRERIEMLKREVGELKEVIEGKKYLLQSYKEHKAELSVKVKELQERLASQSSNSSQSPPVDDPYDYSGDFFSPSMGIALVVIIGVFFILGFISIFISRCSLQGCESISLQSGEGGMSRRGNRGLDPAVIDIFPTFAYSYVKSHKLGKGALECAACLNEFEDEDTIRLLSKCDHVFHLQCVDAWLFKRTTCPVCRANLVPAIKDGEIPLTKESRLSRQ
ncbi:E3 ubiquitin-protein ligase ATL6-like [Telopea speciosissima]|uniref:E3 ubiquitin-protein ligase ATL6-like n=1 Tax=Telopea speciosissima TaxID=54955 RepID=UPI001CC3D1FB|nr:E3 ubiquitin-protein ligase ATL6-like [Telopea speciosissima]